MFAEWIFYQFFLLIYFSVAKRPPVEETASFLQSLLASHGPNYLEKLFGSKARDALAPLGGVEKVAIALSESQTIEGNWDYRKILNEKSLRKDKSAWNLERQTDNVFKN